jgi:hypothetical protein
LYSQFFLAVLYAQFSGEKKTVGMHEPSAGMQLREQEGTILVTAIYEVC